MSPLERCAAAADETKKRFEGRPFELGSNDCARMALFHIRKLGVRIKGPPAGSYKTAAEAKRELKKLGYTSLSKLLDDQFERIALAYVRVGDLVEMPGSEGLSGLAVALGNGRVLGYHEDVEGAEVLQPILATGAWRVVA